MQKSSVSFVIRTKNEERLIGTVLENLNQQTFRNFEIIVVDSGSTDKTLEIIGDFSIKLIQIKPREFNFSYALNLGIKNSKGKYIAIISGHSIPISKTWLADGLNNFQNRKVAAVTGYYNEVPIGYFSEKLGRSFSRLYQNKRLNFCPWMTNTNALIKKSLWEKYPFDEKLTKGCEDYDWASEMLARDYNVIKDPKFSVFHSHLTLGKPGYLQMVPIWEKIVTIIDKRNRPRKSFSRLRT
ncbi:hypothetical protein A2Z23_00160 [Candidatus Curtissbacteria bacterium RBG_16_39_7]|uniref:Glycosyltransferase 2-like domain-containing protein n=1 Tax=Candidatus Curtissbacteria bacterium RBG_16_39_7 TaxID=1797707 RepID=A0A1F5G399_9BACT|nr:MAG: hypothetical protein A2Z23_00160 [Candidatus Curtissbacteria bacterium RBG_16_39_7]